MTPVQMQFVGYTTSVTTMACGMCVFAPLPGQDPAVPTPNTVRQFTYLLPAQAMCKEISRKGNVAVEGN